MDTDCLRCQRPIHDTAYICGNCAGSLRRDLHGLAKVAGEAMTSIARLGRTESSGPPDEVEPDLGKADNALRPTAMLFSWSAAEATWAAVNTVTTWVRHICESSGRLQPTVRTTPCPHDTCTSVRRGELQGAECGLRWTRQHPMAVAAAWLARREQTDWLRYRPEAPEAFDELHYACRAVLNVFDPPRLVYVGPCDGCTLDLHALPGASTATCRECQTTHDLEQRKEWLLNRAQDQLATASWIASFLASVDVVFKADTIRHWAERGRLLSHGRDVMDRPLYRLGDVVELVDEALERAVEREAAAARRTAKRERTSAA